MAEAAGRLSLPIVVTILRTPYMNINSTVTNKAGILLL